MPARSAGSRRAATAPGWRSTTTTSWSSCRPPERPTPTTAMTGSSVDLARARFLAEPAALWRAAYAQAGRTMRHEFWISDMADVDWDAVLDQYRPLLDRIATSDEFADLLQRGGRRAWQLARLHQPGRRLGQHRARRRPARRRPGRQPGRLADRPHPARRGLRPAGTLAARGARHRHRRRRPADRRGRPAGGREQGPWPAADRHGGQAGRADRAARGRRHSRTGPW